DLPLPELYDLAADPGEARNLVASRPADLERLRGLLAHLRKDERTVSRGPEDSSTIERLRALGYVGGSGAAPAEERYTEADDPKRVIALGTKTSEVLRRYHAGDLEGALALCREIIQRRPDMPIAYLHLAFLERARG